MKAIVTILGVVLITVAAMYLLVPAELAADLLSRTRDRPDARARQARHGIRRPRRSFADWQLVYGAEVVPTRCLIVTAAAILPALCNGYLAATVICYNKASKSGAFSCAVSLPD